MAFNAQLYVARERKRQVAALEKRKATILQRIADMQGAVAMLDKEIADHKAEIKSAEAPPK